MISNDFHYYVNRKAFLNVFLAMGHRISVPLMHFSPAAFLTFWSRYLSEDGASALAAHLFGKKNIAEMTRFRIINSKIIQT